MGYTSSKNKKDKVKKSPVILLSPYILRFENSEKISLDHPFVDGVSGTIKLTITTQQPMCIGGKRIKKDGDNTIVKFYRDPATDNICIPESALKGLLRNTIKKLCFGRMSQVDLNEEVAINKEKNKEIKQDIKKVQEVLSSYNEEHCHTTGAPDLAEMILGYLDAEESENDLGGRVKPGYLFLSDHTVKPELTIQKSTVLMSPKPTLKPVWKKYDQSQDIVFPKSTGKGNENVNTQLETVAAGTDFVGSLSFHNLRPFELGALLWMIRLGDEEKCSHQLGAGKPLGFGQVSINYNVSDMSTNHSAYKKISEKEIIQCSLRQFLDLMNQASKNVVEHDGSDINSLWYKTPQYHGFFALAHKDSEKKQLNREKSYSLPLKDKELMPVLLKDSLATLLKP